MRFPPLLIPLAVMFWAATATPAWGLDSRSATQPASPTYRVDDSITVELAACDRLPVGDSRTEFLAKAIDRHPENPDTLRLEFRLGVELSQRPVKEQDREKQWAQGLDMFERIIATRKHRDYYSPEPVDHSYAAQIEVPQAAISAAGLTHDRAKAREQLLFAMSCMQETHRWRVEDWKKPYTEPELSDLPQGPREISKRISRLHAHQQRQARAEAGEVFSPLELNVVEGAVRSYMQTRADNPTAAMNELIQKFPDTPIAKAAQKQLEQAQVGRSKSSPAALE